MPEENAFWMLVASMNRPTAPLRELFLPGMVKVTPYACAIIFMSTRQHSTTVDI